MHAFPLLHPFLQSNSVSSEECETTSKQLLTFQRNYKTGLDPKQLAKKIWLSSHLIVSSINSLITIGV